MEIMESNYNNYENKYEVTISKSVMIEYHERLINSIYKALTLFEGKDYVTKKVVMSEAEAIENFKRYSNNLIFEVSGCKHLFYKSPDFISLLANLVELHRKCNHKDVRTLVFICIDIVKKMKRGLEEDES